MNKMFSIGVHYSIISTIFCSVILSKSQSEGSYVIAYVVFNITDKDTGDMERLGSVDNFDDMAAYGSTSPKENISGVVITAANQSGHIYGCVMNPYKHVTVSEPWVALAERGDCSFAQKINQAAAANATGIIIYDTGETHTRMSNSGAENIVSISIPCKIGKTVASRVTEGDYVKVTITRSMEYSTYSVRNKTSIIFVSLSFLILMIISLTWLIIYYVQRFRIVQAPDILKQRRSQVKSLIKNLEQKILTEEDKELSNEEICPICIESYKIDDVLRILQCKHFFHRRCVDPWLKMKETCPMCKFDVLKACGLRSSPLGAAIIYGSRVNVPPVEIWDPIQDQVASTSSTDSLMPASDQESTVLVVLEENSENGIGNSEHNNNTNLEEQDNLSVTDSPGNI